MSIIAYHLIFSVFLFFSANSIARHCIDEVASVYAFRDMHNEAENIFSDMDYKIKTYGKDHLCSIKHLDSFVDVFNIEENLRKKAKLMIINRGMINDEFYIRGATDTATESEICHYSDQLYREIKPLHALFAQYRERKLYYQHEEHCRLHLEYIIQKEKKKR